MKTFYFALKPDLVSWKICSKKEGIQLFYETTLILQI